MQVGQEQADYESEEPTPRKGGIVMAEDDLEVGQFVCVYNLKRQPEDAAPIMGQSLEVKAVCLPFFVGQLLSDPSMPTLTLDCRYLHLMKVTKEFVEAQKKGAQQQEQGTPMMMVPKRKRKEEQ